MTSPVDWDQFTDPTNVETRRRIQLQQAPDTLTRQIVELLHDTNAFVSEDATKAVFVAGGKLSRVARELVGDEVHYTIKTLSRYGLTGRLTELAEWEAAGGRLDAPPGNVVNDIIERADELCTEMPMLNQIVTYPMFAADGSLHLTPGYMRETRCWYVPPSGLSIPEVSVAPTDDEIAKAVSLIFDDLFVDFPFVSQADRANALTILLEPFARRLIPGPTPIHAIDAPKEGTGKSLLADMALLPSMGTFPKSSTQSTTEEEWKKQITSIMLGGTPYWYCDNLRTTLDSGHLASTITKSVYEERILGGNSMCVRPINHTWVITGNNISYSGEMVRRVVPSYLNAHSETPHIGRVFKHDNIRQWAMEHRGELIWAALTIIQRWIAKGKPRKHVVKPLGMFEAWSEIMGNILDLAGVEGFMGNLSTFYDEAVKEEHDVSPFIHAWYEQFGTAKVMAKDLIGLAHEHLELTKVIGDMRPKPTSKQISSLLGKIKKRVYAGLEVVHEPRKGKADLYMIVSVDVAKVVVAALEINKEQLGSIHPNGQEGDGTNLFDKL